MLLADDCHSGCGSGPTAAAEEEDRGDAGGIPLREE